MSKKVLGTALKIVGIGVLTVVTAGTAIVVGAGAGLGFAAATYGTVFLAGAAALNIGNNLLAADRAAKAAQSARAEQIRAMVNPNAFANWVFGETAMPVQIIYTEVHGSKKDKATIIYAGAAHQIHSYGDLYINDELITFSGNDATGAWAGAVSRYTNLGTEGQTALTPPGSTWPSTARGRGFPHFCLQFNLEHDKLKNGVPDRITQVIKAMPVYDPRLDTTVGGSGSHRADDQTTWEYTNGGTDIGANWALIDLAYILGWYNNGKLVFGRGADPEDIDYASFISAANACDALIDAIPRYHIGGIERIDGDHDRVISALEATIGGKIAKPGGKYHCWAPYDDLVALETISEDDLIRDVGVHFQDARSIENIYNVGVGQFINPDILYLPDSYPEVRETGAITDHGRERLMQYDTPFLQHEKRCQRVILQQIRRSIFGRVWQVPVGPKYFRRTVFDVLNLNIRETNFTDTFVRVTDRQLSPNGLIIFTLEEESALIYDTTATLGTMASRNVPATFDATSSIAVANLALAQESVVGTGGSISDAIEISFDDPGPLVKQHDIEIKVDGTTKWQPVISKRLDAGELLLAPVEPATLYNVRVRHVTIFNVASAWATDDITTSNTATQDFDSIGGVNKPDDGATRNYNRGTYNSVTTYYLNDIVQHNGSSFISIWPSAFSNFAPETTPTDNSHWQLFAAKGDTGEAATAYSGSSTVSSGGPYNLRTLANADGYDGIGDATYYLTVNGNLTGAAGANDGGNGGICIDTGSWPAGITLDLKVTVNSTRFVRGGGGGGGDGGNSTPGQRAGNAGGTGGHAIVMNADLTVVNNGTIHGGGGGGGGGSGEAGGVYGCGGGGGYPNGGHGVAGDSAPQDGSNGTTSGGGAGGSGSGVNNGGNGGGAGTNGSNGVDGQPAGGTGGTKGDAIKKNGHTLTYSGSGSHSGIGT